jgi:uncharacterized protein RhaS with RHS repeats
LEDDESLKTATGSNGCDYENAPGLQRWPNRDPLQERGGINLYGFVRNNPISNLDRDGLDVYQLQRTAHALGGLVDHRELFIDNTGMKDKQGYSINISVNFDSDGLKVVPTRKSLCGYLENGKKNDPDLCVNEHLKTDEDESKRLVNYFLGRVPNSKGDYLFGVNDCRTTFKDARIFIEGSRDSTGLKTAIFTTPPFIP